MKKFLFILFLFLAEAVIAQNKAYLATADKAFENKDYYTAAYYYEKCLNNESAASPGAIPYFSIRKKEKLTDEDIAYITFQLGESYRLYKNYKLAEPNYKQIVESNLSSYPLARLWYAECLRSDDHLSDAINQLKQFIRDNQNNKDYVEVGNKELNDCLYASDQMKHHSLADVNKMTGNFAGDAGDFGLISRGNQYWFTSSRTAGGNVARYNRIYTGSADGSGITKIDFNPSLGEDVHYGPVSIDGTGTRMYLTAWYIENGKTVVVLYLSKLMDGKWGHPLRLNDFVNVSGFNSMQPCVTPDGKHLYYASNKPGGLGGTDIWMSNLDADGIPVDANNLGNEVNTADDEQAPFFNVNQNRLVYSSKGFTGMGGFDLYESFNKDGEWSAPQNLGYPFNSVKDDLYYFQDSRDENKVFLSSDRNSECCLNLYSITFKQLVFSGIVIDCASNKPLAGVKISLIDSISKKQVDAMSTSDNGKYAFKVELNHPYNLKLEKTSYFTRLVPVASVSSTKTDTLFSPVICQYEYKINKPIVIENVFYDFNKATLRPESKQVLEGLVALLKDNPKIKVELSSHTDSFGPAWFNLRLSQARAQSCVDYVISRGIDRSRITAKGYGSSRPIAPNKLPNGKDNPAGRQLNRRTEFKVVKD